MKGTENTKQKSTHNRGVNRRTFVKMLPAVGVASIAVSSSAAPANPAEQQQQQPQTPQRVTKEMLHAAEQLIGIELTDAQEAMALPGVNRNLASYEALRKIDIPLDTEPAIAFHPALPGKKFNGRAAKLQLSKQEIPKYNALEEVAFFTTAQLAELVRTRRVSPVELT